MAATPGSGVRWHSAWPPGPWPCRPLTPPTIRTARGPEQRLRRRAGAGVRVRRHPGPLRLARALARQPLRHRAPVARGPVGARHRGRLHHRHLPVQGQDRERGGGEAMERDASGSRIREAHRSRPRHATARYVAPVVILVAGLLRGVDGAVERGPRPRARRAQLLVSAGAPRAGRRAARPTCCRSWRSAASSSAHASILGADRARRGSSSDSSTSPSSCSRSFGHPSRPADLGATLRQLHARRARTSKP